MVDYIVASAIGSNCTQAFILGSGRPPVPAKLVSQILTGKFIELSELIPENLAPPTTESTSFTIEGRSIVPTTTSSRKKTEISDILTWVECFNSYISVITAFHLERVRDLLAYMALIMRLAKQFPGLCWYTYDRAYRLEAAASNSKNWSQINADLYHYHTSVAAKPMQAQATRYGEPRGDPRSMIFVNHGMAEHAAVHANLVDFAINVIEMGAAERTTQSTAQSSRANVGEALAKTQAASDSQNKLKRDGVCNLNVFSDHDSKTPHEYIRVTGKYIRVTYEYIRVHTGTYEYIRDTYQ